MHQQASSKRQCGDDLNSACPLAYLTLSLSLFAPPDAPCCNHAVVYKREKRVDQVQAKHRPLEPAPSMYSKYRVPEEHDTSSVNRFSSRLSALGCWLRLIHKSLKLAESERASAVMIDKPTRGLGSCSGYTQSKQAYFGVCTLLKSNLIQALCMYVGIISV